MTGIDERELKQQFASDNYAGICPEAWMATEAANRGHATAYEIIASDWSSDVCSSDLFRPTLHAYATSARDIYLCSASTPDRKSVV